MYIVGFAETVRDVLRESGIVIIDGGLNDVRIIGFGIFARESWQTDGGVLASCFQRRVLYFFVSCLLERVSRANFKWRFSSSS